jgi:hypothetical protein
MGIVALLLLAAAPSAGQDEGARGDPRLILPAREEDGRRLCRSTFDRHFGRFYGRRLPEAEKLEGSATTIVLGAPETNPVLADLVRKGARLTPRDLGDEGFQLLTHESGGARAVIGYARSPRGLKHACQELIFYRMPATAAGLSVDWPLDVVMKPEFAYRSTYMLPCWSYMDTIASWERALHFNSEIGLNRMWFWLDGFKLAGHKGAGKVPEPYDTDYDYTASPLSDEKNVQKLVDLANDEGMKFYVGGSWLGWWHHGVEVGQDPEKGKRYYRDFLRTFKGIGGFFFEPRGEPDGTKIDEGKNPQAEARALQEFVRETLRDRPDLEFAIAIGSYNTEAYLRFMADAKLDPKQVYWWWCWGDPVRDRETKGTNRFPQIVTWHHAMPGAAAGTHGSRLPPEPRHRGLAGAATTQEASSGWGDPWSRATGIWPKLSRPVDLDPYSMAYFYLQYSFRERCWNLGLSDDEFEARLRRRLFDADAPDAAGRRYAELSRMILRVYDRGPAPTAEEVASVRGFLDSLKKRRWTPRTEDTLVRMEEALSRLLRRADK